MSTDIVTGVGEAKSDAKPTRPLRVLLSAYACEPGKGSEPGVGWNWVQQVARSHDVWVLTRSSNRQAIEAAMAREPLPRARWIYVDLPSWSRWWKKGTRGLHLYYYLWQVAAYIPARRAHARIRFDVAHHVTFVNYWMPSLIALLPIPFVWGPVGGGESAPRSFRHDFSRLGQFHELARDFVRRLAQADPLVRLTASRAAIGFATTAHTQRQMRSLGCQNTAVYSEAGIPSHELAKQRPSVTAKERFTVISMGRLIHWKGFHIGLRAFARFCRSYPDADYWVLGDGDERAGLEQLALELGVSDNVQFFGNVPRDSALEMLAAASVLLHPSLHDSGGWVCLEAMAAGRPVVCLDLGGPSLQVTDETGIKVPATTPHQAEIDLAHALLSIARNGQVRQTLGAAGRHRIEQCFAWDRKGAFISAVYAKLAPERATCN
jgi:glycosyltransferase involved in cell wall biosynthesis